MEPAGVRQENSLCLIPHVERKVQSVGNEPRGNKMKGPFMNPSCHASLCTTTHSAYIWLVAIVYNNIIIISFTGLRRKVRKDTAW